MNHIATSTAPRATAIPKRISGRFMNPSLARPSADAIIRGALRTRVMEIQPVNLNEIVGVTLGMLVVLIPVLGATIRFAARPLVEALMQAGVIGPRTLAANEAELGRLSRRVLELEQELSRRKLEPIAPISGEPARSIELQRPHLVD